MDNLTRELREALAEKHHTMVAQLHQFCNINSGTTHLAGLIHMHQTLQEAFRPVADTVESISFPGIDTINMAGELEVQRVGDALMVSRRPELSRRILLAGHMDTVFHAEHPFQQVQYMSDNEINGPGVADMKGGLIVLLHALQMFEQLPEAASIGWDVLINADEEIGSPASGPYFETIANQYQAGMIYEPAMFSDGTLAKNRRGSGKLTLVAKGKAAHVGRAFQEGKNAISYIAEAIIAIHSLNNQRDGVTINVGKIAGGEALNVVPDRAVAKLDVRIQSPADEQWVWEQIHSIIHSLHRCGYSLEIEGVFGRPVKKVCGKTERFFHRIQSLAKKMDLDLQWQDSGGCCDGNNLGKKGLAVLDTLGVRGGNIHSANEFILLDSLVERALLSTLILLDLAQGGLEEINK